MKIKHYQGYGSLTMKVLTNKEDDLVIEVYGNHEYGLETDDKYLVEQWLVNHVRGKKDRKIKAISHETHYVREFVERYGKEIDVEHCVYTIKLRALNEPNW